jgi:hypothetical protein
MGQICDVKWDIRISCFNGMRSGALAFFLRVATRRGRANAVLAVASEMIGWGDDQRRLHEGSLLPRARPITGVSHRCLWRMVFSLWMRTAMFLVTKFEPRLQSVRKISRRPPLTHRESPATNGNQAGQRREMSEVRAQMRARVKRDGWK